MNAPPAGSVGVAVAVRVGVGVNDGSMTGKVGVGVEVDRITGMVGVDVAVFVAVAEIKGVSVGVRVVVRVGVGVEVGGLQIPIKKGLENGEVSFTLPAPIASVVMFGPSNASFQVKVPPADAVIAPS